MKTPRFPNADDHRRVKYLIEHDERLAQHVAIYMQANANLMLYTEAEYGEDMCNQICGCAAVQTGFFMDRMISEHFAPEGDE